MWCKVSTYFISFVPSLIYAGLATGLLEVCGRENNFVLRDNLITFSVLLKATSQDFTFTFLNNNLSKLLFLMDTCKIQAASVGFELMTSAMLVQCSEWVHTLSSVGRVLH